MKSGAKQPLVYILGIMLLFSPFAKARVKIPGDSLALKTEQRLQAKKMNEEKVKLLLHLSDWYFEGAGTPADKLQKSVALAQEALQNSQTLYYTRGIALSSLKLSILLQEGKKYAAARYYANKATGAFQKLNEPDLLGESWVMVWSANSLLGLPYGKRLGLLDKAAAAFRQAGNRYREADCLKEQADICQLMGDYARSMQLLKKALQHYKSVKYKRLHCIYDLMGRVYLLLGDMKQGVEYILMAERIARQFEHESLFTCTLNNSIGMAYDETGQPEKALFYFRKSLGIAIKYDHLESILILLRNNAEVLTRLNKTGEALQLIKDIQTKYPKINHLEAPVVACMMVEIYIKRHQYTKAAPYSAIIEKYIQKDSLGSGSQELFNACTALIKLNINTGNYKKASGYNDIFQGLCKNINKPYYCNYYNLWEFKIDSASGNYLPAMKHFQKYKEVNEALFNEKKSRQINQLSILYETEKKDKNIQILERRTVLQQSRLKQTDFIMNVVLGGLFFMTAGSIAMYKGYRLKQKNNKVLKEQKDMIDAKNESLEHLVSEKEWLLKEIHHRVKNNLQMVVGLLASQIEYLKGEEAVEAINESRRRVEAMAMIHQKLYRSDNISMIDMPSYIAELTEYLADSFDKIKSIRFILDIDKVEFPLSHSIPLGLLLNEAITNAIKYAFPDGRDGAIKIFLKPEGPSAYRLIIWDNGIGIPLNFDPDTCSSLGLRLIKGLSDDLQGRFSISRNNGTKIALTFALDNYRHDMKIN